MALYKNKQKSWYILLGISLVATSCLLISTVYSNANRQAPSVTITRAAQDIASTSSAVTTSQETTTVTSQNSISSVTSASVNSVQSSQAVSTAPLPELAIAIPPPKVVVLAADNTPSSQPKLVTLAQSSASVVSSLPAIIPPPLAQCDTGLHAGILAAINQFRVENNKFAIDIDAALTTVSCNYSTWMNQTGDFTHYGYGSTPPERCAKLNTSCDSENLAMVQNFDPQHIVDLWIASDGHRAVLLGDNTAVGFGIVGNYVTADFR